LYQIENNDKNEISVNNNNNNNDNSSNNNNSFNQSETNSITISVTSYSTTSSCDDDDDAQEDENEEFQAIYKRITTSTNNNNNIETNLNNIATSDINALKNLFKLLKLYKLEHYMNDLVDQDYSSTFSLHKLKQNDLDKLNVSPYDKKKFFKLQLFIKQFMNTISLSSHNNNNNKQIIMTTNQQRRSSSCAASVTTSTEANNLIDDKVKKMITIKKQAQKPTITVKTAAAAVAAANQNQTNETARSSSNQNLNQRHISRNYSGSNLNEPNWSNNKPPPPPTSSKPHFIKNSNLSNNKRIVAKTANKNRFSLVHRAKSSEPVKKVPTSLTSKSSTQIQDNNIIIPQVNHPNNPHSKVKCDYIENVQLIKTNTYNYGVPHQMQKVLIKKSKSNHNLPIETTTNSSTLTTNEIYVYARKRPKLACESKFSDVIQIQSSSKSAASIFVNESKQAVDGSPILRKNEFHFDKLFDETKTNEDIFKSSIQSYIDESGNNSGSRNDFACICFGQTGSGKTHTLFGNKQQDGLKKTIEQAQLNRHIGCTSFNKASSRSHAVIQFKVPNVFSSSNSGQVIMTKQFTNSSSSSSSSKTKQTKPNKPFRVLFIDLAGSERGIDAQTNQNDNRKEGAEINQSLLALKECIRCIDQSCSHAPFRQSKLTRVLRDSFIGSGKTILIATVSPTDDCVSCSINTLQYANRVRQMTLKNRVKHQQNNKSTFLNSDLPPKSRKIYKDIFNNDEETINNNNNNNNIKTFIASSPISQDNNVKIPLVSSNTDTVTSKQVPSLFHPSKINMSSTPIKTVTNVTTTTTTTTTNKQTLFSPNTDTDLLLFENDTPIKGHKLKYIAPTPTITNNIQPIQHLADQYFARVVSKPNDLNNKMYYSKLNKNEDAESGVESEELNKSNEQQQQQNNNKKHNQTNTTNVDESLNRLRKKQKELIESKKYLNAIQFEETQADLTDYGSKLNENSHFYINNNNQKHSTDQGHLKTYIQNLENKLQNLRNEMNDNSNNNNQYQNNKKEVIRERSLSTDSCDSLKEIKKNDIRQVCLDFCI